METRLRINLWLAGNQRRQGKIRDKKTAFWKIDCEGAGKKGTAW